MLYSKIEGVGNSKKMVVIHGFLGMSDNWKTMAVKYTSLGHEVHSLDMRNHGKSFHSDDFSYELMVADVHAYVETQSLTSVTILGHSMGGKVAMQFACTYPILVDSLIIADIGPKYYPQHHQNILAGLNAVDFSVITNRNAVDECLQPYIKEEGTRQFLLKSLYWIDPGKQLAFRFNLKALTQYIEEIGKPLPNEAHYAGAVLFIKGALSTYIVEADYPSIKNHFPNAVFETVSQAGHWLHAENPVDFYRYTSTFLIQ